MSDWAARKVGQVRGLRRGSVFPVRLTDEERADLERCRDESAGPEGLGRQKSGFFFELPHRAPYPLGAEG